MKLNIFKKNNTKKGFTLIELIICIALISIIGTASFFGVKKIEKNKKISTLTKLKSTILNAAQVYIETHSDTKSQLYSEKNAVVLPLNVLVNDGLLDLSTTTLEDSDIENEYVLAALTKTNSDGDCINITINTSWDMSKDSPIYICTDSSGNSNISIIDPSSTSNTTKASKKQLIFRCEGVNNYITYSGNTYRILYIDTDDSLILYNSGTFGDVFKGKILSLYGTTTPTTSTDISYSEISNYVDSYEDGGCITYGTYYVKSTKNYNTITGEVYIDYVDYLITSTTYFKSDSSNTSTRSSWVGGSISSLGYSGGMKIHLKSCMKITGGTGTIYNPYTLEDKCS